MTRHYGDQIESLSRVICKKVDKNILSILKKYFEPGELRYKFACLNVGLCKTWKDTNETVFQQKALRELSAFEDSYVLSHPVRCLIHLETSFNKPHFTENEIEQMCSKIKYLYKIFVIDINFCIAYLSHWSDHRLGIRVEPLRQSFCGGIHDVIQQLHCAHVRMLELEGEGDDAFITSSWLREVCCD